MTVVVEGVAVRDLAFHAADRQVHAREPPRRVVGLLAADGDIAEPATVRADKRLVLHEHARRAAARIVDTSPIGLDHLDEKRDHAARGVELAALLAVGARELGEEVLVHAPEYILRPAVGIPDPDGAHQVDELAETVLVERETGVVPGQHALERWVVPLNPGHGFVHELADGWLTRLIPDPGPARLTWHPEDALGPVRAGVFRIRSGRLLGFPIRRAVPRTRPTRT